MTPAGWLWAAPGRNTETLLKFFDALGPARSAGLTHVSADGAEWIHAAVAQRAPQAMLCLDPIYGDVRVMPTLPTFGLVGGCAASLMSA